MRQTPLPYLPLFDFPGIRNPLAIIGLTTVSVSVTILSMDPRVPHLNARLQGYTTTIFAEMSALAEATGSINLGQGFPDVDGPVEIKEAAIAAITAGRNQYAPGAGIAPLRRAVAGHQQLFYGLSYDADDEILITAGATEAIAAALLSLCETGDEVVMFEPFYDSYAAGVSMAGAQRKVVRLGAPDWAFDAQELESAIGPRTRALILNSPHNPTGKVFSHEELAYIARVCVDHDLIAITDEVYEHLIFDRVHEPLSTFPGMAERTIQISSGAKTFSFTGWKIGWACGPAPLIRALRTAKQFLTYVNGTPFQYAIAEALEAGTRYIDGIAAGLRPRRDLLSSGLKSLGLDVFDTAGTYFLTTDVAPLGQLDGMQFCRSLPERCRVVAVPSGVFYDDPTAPCSMVRWTFCKQTELLVEALERLESLRN